MLSTKEKIQKDANLRKYSDLINKIAKDEGIAEANKIADSIIKNTYRTLMTRGMKGCYVYCVDKWMQEYLKNKSNVL